MKSTGKAFIRKVGTVDEEGQLHGWEFDCLGVIPAFSIEDDGVFICGYTLDELRSISNGSMLPARVQ